MLRLNDLLEQITAYAPGADLDVVMRAYFYAAKAHKEQTRKSGEAYFTHPLAVAGILVDEHMDVDTVATALLHDTIEDTMATREELATLFSPTIADLVDGVTKMGKLEFRSKEEAAAENFRKMMLAMSRDIRVILVKLADRLHNMSTLDAMRDDKRRRIAQETLDIYAPLAARLGITTWKIRLEDMCFSYLHPEVHDDIRRQLAETADERQEYIDETSDALRAFMTDRGITGTVSGRAKHLMSIYRKMAASNLEFDQLHDLLAFRICVDTVSDCYAALGHVHGTFAPVPGRFKDYIAMPKSNGYKSLHTTVMGPGHRRVEIQIRTHEMHNVNEHGVAAHWTYKEGHLALSRDEIAKITRLGEVVESAREVEDPDEFMEALRIDLFHNEVYVFTPAGDVKEFPRGATALDFAYSIHTEVGNHCRGARVNGRMVPLRYVLRSGDKLEILTSESQYPRRDWLKFVKTSRALSRIRRYLREEERETGIRIGREMLDNELKKHGSTLQAQVKSGQLKKVLKARGERDVENILISLAQGHTQPTEIVRELLPGKDWEVEDSGQEGALNKLLKRIRRRQQTPVLITGEEDVLVTFARCCNPLPGEGVSGFVTRGRGISVHRRECPQLLALEPERRIPVEWDSAVNGGRHTGEIMVTCVDRPGMLANITKTCTDAGINISSAQVKVVEDEKAECALEVGVTSLDELRTLIRRLQKIKGVISVDRVAR